MTVLERIRADMGRWEAVRAEVLRGVRPEAPPRPLSPDLRAYRDRLTQVVTRHPGATWPEVASKVPDRGESSVRCRLLDWADPENGPFHQHGTGPSRRFFPGPCSDTCPGRPPAG